MKEISTDIESIGFHYKLLNLQNLNKHQREKYYHVNNDCKVQQHFLLLLQGS